MIKEQINAAKNLLYWMEEQDPYIERIINVVQDNPEFFNCRAGESCLMRAASTLEKLIAAQQVQG